MHCAKLAIFLQISTNFLRFFRIVNVNLHVLLKFCLAKSHEKICNRFGNSRLSVIQISYLEIWMLVKQKSLRTGTVESESLRRYSFKGFENKGIGAVNN